MPDRLKSICFRCRVNKWIVDYKGGCAANVSSISICLSCEQSEKIDKLERYVRERDSKIKALEDLVSKLGKKVDNLGETKADDNCESRCSRRAVNDILAVKESNFKNNTQYCMQAREIEAKVDELREVVIENRDNIVESGRDIVEIRQEIVSLKRGNDFQAVKGKKSAKACTVKSDKGIPLTNRFAVLSEEETYLIGDSLIREQTEHFGNKNKRRRTVKSFPGCKIRKVTEEVGKLHPQSGNSCIIAHAGSNDLFSRGTKEGNSEAIVKDFEVMVDKVAEKTSKGLVVGILPRRYANYCTLSKAIGINNRTKKYCDARRVGFLDLWDNFMGKWHYFKKDGIHLNEVGHRKLGEILNQECERLIKLDEDSVKAISEKFLSQFQDVLKSRAAPQVLDRSESENLEGSFLGFTKEN